MATKRKSDPKEWVNDPSLRWCGYRYGEVLWSDVHQTQVRFVRYLPNDDIELASVDAIAQLPGSVSANQVRRVSCQSDNRSDWVVVKVRVPEGHAWFAMERKSHERIPCVDQNEAETICRERMGCLNPLNNSGN